MKFRSSQRDMLSAEQSLIIDYVLWSPENITCSVNYG